MILIHPARVFPAHAGVFLSAKEEPPETGGFFCAASKKDQPPLVVGSLGDGSHNLPDNDARVVDRKHMHL